MPKSKHSPRSKFATKFINERINEAKKSVLEWKNLNEPVLEAYSTGRLQAYELALELIKKF